MSAVARPRTRPGGPTTGRQLRVVRPSAPRHRLLFVVLLLALAAAAVFAAVSLNALAAGDAVAARTLEREVAGQERVYGQLVADVARLEDPARLRRIATEELGMVEPESVRVLHLDRSLDVDAAVEEAVAGTDPADPLKPILTQER